MRIAQRAVLALTVTGLTVPAVAGNWVNFVDETAVRMPTSLNLPSLSVSDVEEKDYAWGDVNNNGRIDLVNVRKQPFTTTGRRTNVLFMNEGFAEGHSVNGVLVDRTALYATASDVPGDMGFRTPTNDRDVVLVDVNMNGWLDIVTAPTLTDNAAKHLSHPRVYVNLGESGGVWQGFEHQDDRIPVMHPTAGPRFCSVAAGDLTGNGYPDLYFGDYDSGGSQIFDYNNKLLINDGNGFFADESDLRLTHQMRLSAFGAASVIADMNNNGHLDVVKQTSLNPPQHVAITYNNPSNPGMFNAYQIIYTLAPYFVSVGDLNNNGMLDILVVDDGVDRVLFQTGVSNGQSQFVSKTLPPSSGNFGGNSLIVDLDNDGFSDIIITDVDVDIPGFDGCSGNRRTLIYRNLGNGSQPDFAEIGQVIPNNMLTGVHDVAAMDINGNGWLDLVIGRCSGTQVWMNVPPTGVTMSYPAGVPEYVAVDEPSSFDVMFEVIGATGIASGTEFVNIRQPGGTFQSIPLNALGGNLYEVTLPAMECPEQVAFYISVETIDGGMFRDPPGAPAQLFVATAAEGMEVTVDDDIEGDVSEWKIYSVDLTGGEWEAAIPNGTIVGGSFAAPDFDASNGLGAYAFVTENGPPGAPAGAHDVKGGPTFLETPRFSLDGTDGVISYSYWFFCSGFGTPNERFFWVEISNDDGDTWVPVPSQTSASSNQEWVTTSFVAGDFIMPTALMRVRFVTADQPNNSITEAGVDNLLVEAFICPSSGCVGDLNGDGVVNSSDLLELLNEWGPCKGCPADLNGDGVVNSSDLLELLNAWGPCD